MSSNTIKVDKEELERQILVLERLCADRDLRDAVSVIQESVTQSTGSTAENIKAINSCLKEMDQQLSYLYTRTLDFLKNAQTSFIEADEGLAERIKNGEK